MTRSVINFVHFNLSLRPIYMEARISCFLFRSHFLTKVVTAWVIDGSFSAFHRHSL